MTADQINVAIGECLGRSKTNNPYKEDCGWCEGTGVARHENLGPGGLDACPICENDNRPNFYSDLNAMYSAEEKILFLGEEEWERYTDLLLTVIIKKLGYSGASWLVHASAPSRAEAFLRYHGKWIETKSA